MECDKKVLIVLLNWNGSQDTLACCESLNSVDNIKDGNADILIIDNDSDADSFNLLRAGLESIYTVSTEIKISSDLQDSYDLKSTEAYNNVFLFSSRINHGFAKGCNLGAKFAESKGYGYILFLNNDTVVEPDFLKPLLDSLNSADAAIPQIRYHYDSTLMWNCGGEISKFGARKYYYAKENIGKIIFPSEVFPVTFATGCCILFRTEYFKLIGRFSERFFFGEEDIELSLRMLKFKSRVVCNTQSVIYHKVGSSIQGSPERLLRKAYIHYLNRFVNMKLHLGVAWYIWLIPSVFKVVINLIKINHQSLRESYVFVRSLVVDSFSLTEVNKDKFDAVLRDGIK
ncbi:TPA: glycosyltransferase family 2 protein [Enterobacter cloacae]|uniref:glycosyltransferase n=1 Tax=Enterobacter cloacae TaxID=550 RepID=UPI0018C230A2|nr:glycosyltransferase family 2 protein [Enterobacter cloacae]MBG0521695.1 glycosyltransferase family 2 protein [Enterobacter cloacae]